MTEEQKPEKIVKKLRKGSLVRVDRNKFENSLESKASDAALPAYIFDGPGEVLNVKDDYVQVRWRMPVPDVWFRNDQLAEWSEVK
tara:strand:+ start:690 stop:944 length:255 start_codon:yes stop_codon:yes gene_type:complete